MLVSTLVLGQGGSLNLIQALENIVIWRLMRFRILLAPRELARNLPFFDLAIDKEIRDADFFAKLIQGYSEGLVVPNMMRGLQPVIPCRTTLA